MRITTIAITIISSIMVNPKRADDRFLPSARAAGLPLRISSAIRRFLHGFRIHVKHVLPAPTVGLGIVLPAPLSPIRRIGERVFWNAPQEAEFFVRLRRHLHTLH